MNNFGPAFLIDINHRILAPNLKNMLRKSNKKSVITLNCTETWKQLALVRADKTYTNVFEPKQDLTVVETLMMALSPSLEYEKKPSNKKVKKDEKKEEKQFDSVFLSNEEVLGKYGGNELDTPGIT